VTVVLEIVTKPADRVRFSEDGEVALAGILEVDRGTAFEGFTEPELERMADRLDTEDRIVVSGAVWSGFPELAVNLGQCPQDRWGEAVLDLRLSMLTKHGRAIGAEAIAEATNGIRRIGPRADVGELVEMGELDRATEALQATARLIGEVFQFGRDFGWVQVRREDEPGFEQIEVDSGERGARGQAGADRSQDRRVARESGCSGRAGCSEPDGDRLAEVGDPAPRGGCWRAGGRYLPWRPMRTNGRTLYRS